MKLNRTYCSNIIRAQSIWRKTVRSSVLGALGTPIYVISFLRTRLKTTSYQFYIAAHNTRLQIFTKSLQGNLFEKFYEMIMGWKNIDTLQMGPP